MSSIQPKKQDLDGVEYLSANETTNIKISGDDSSSNGARIELGKDLTTTPIISHLSGDGFDFGVLGDFTFPQMVLSKLKIQAVETPFPATDTLKINKKVLLDDGTNTGTLDINGTGDLEISSSGNIQLNPTGALGIGGANYGTAGQVLTSNGASAPTWDTPTGASYPYLNVAFLYSVASTYQTFTINRIVPNLTLGNPPNTTTSSRGTWTLTDTGYIVPDTGRYSISFSATSQGAVLWAWYIVVNGANGTATFDANNGAIIRYQSSRACNLGISTLTLTAGDIVGIKGTDSPTITQGQYWFNIAYIGA
jgi:hypothetical protein